MYSHLKILCACLQLFGISSALNAQRTLNKLEVEDIKREVVKKIAARPPETLLLRDALPQYLNVQAGRAISAPLSLQTSDIIRRLSHVGLLRDEQYSRAVLIHIESDRVAGPVADDTDHPECVAVGSSAQEFCCTGILVSPQLVVTAGHCHDSCGRFISIGPYAGGPKSTVLKVKKAFRHDGFKRIIDPTIPHYSFLNNDLSVLVLESEFRGVAPGRIASTQLINRVLGASRQAWIVGFGHTNSSGTTGKGTRRIGGPAFFADVKDAIYGAFPETELVLGKHPAQLDSCNGDSGGPIYIIDSGTTAVAATTSRATRNSNVACGEGGIYVRLDKYFDWMTKIAKDENVIAPEIAQ